MQTFLPFPDFARSANVLDRRRLGKQRVECLQITQQLILGRGAYPHHPAVKMWANHVGQLYKYSRAICEEWQARGYNDSCLEKIKALVLKLPALHFNPPPWLGNSDLHLSHQSNLLRKLPSHYSIHFPGVPDNLEYVWPTHLKQS